jgi:hypothetical protein
MTVINTAWGEVGSALWEVPDTELAALETRLLALADEEPGRIGDAFRAFASMVTTERGTRGRNWTAEREPRPRRSSTRIRVG